MKLILHRLSQDARVTFGELTDAENRHICVTLELPWRNNESGKSCVPAGTYTCKRDWHHPNDLEHRYIVWELQGVPGGRTDVQCHIANKPSQLLGCIAPGESYGTLDGEPAVLASGVAFRRLMDLTKDAVTLTLEIRDVPATEAKAA